MPPQKSTEQCKVFLEFMEAHPDIAKGFVKGDKVKQDQLWGDLTSRLNACGPPNRDTAVWKKTWSDWRRSIKTRLAENKSLLQKTGGGEYQQHHLTEVEERLAVICNIFHAVEGISNAKSFGSVKRKQDDSEFCEIIEMSPNSTNPKSPNNSYTSKVPSPDLSPLKKRKTFCGDIKDIIGQEKKNFEYMGTKLDEMNGTFNDSAKYLKNIDKNLNEIRSIKRRELKETKRHNLEIEKLNKTKIETKIEFLKLERMKLGMAD